MLRTVTAASAEPVSLAEAKQHLRVDFADDDALITSLIAAATLHAQAMVQRRFVRQEVEWVIDGWRQRILLPIAPVAIDGVVSIRYADWASQALQEMPADMYVVQPYGSSVSIIPSYSTFWPPVFAVAPEPVVIRFVVGDDVKDVAPNVSAAIKLIVGHLYENRQSVIAGSAVQVVELPQGAEALLLQEAW